MSQNPSLSIIVPVYNGERRLIAALTALTEFLRPRMTFEIIVVDDGSTDRTAALAEAFAAANPETKLLRLGANAGKGAAVRHGMLRAAGDRACFCDADLPIPLTELEKLLRALEQGADVAIASRTLPGSRIAPAPGADRQVFSRLFNGLIRWLFGLRYRDTQCGLKGFRRKAARAIFSQARIDGFAFDVELLLLSDRMGLTVTEFPVMWDNPSMSTVNIRAQAWPICQDLWRISRNLHLERYGRPAAARNLVAAK